MQKQNSNAITVNKKSMNRQQASQHYKFSPIFSLGQQEHDEPITKIVTSDYQKQNIRSNKKKGLFTSCLKCYMKDINHFIAETPIITISNQNQQNSYLEKHTKAQETLEVQKKLVTQVQERHQQYIVDEKLIYDNESIIQQQDILPVKTKRVYDNLNNKTGGLTMDQALGITKINTKELTIPQNKKLLILDLDETLVHSTFTEMEIQNSDFQLSITMDDEQSITYNIGVFIRPYLKEFLEEASKLFTLWIFTASLQIYCDAVMNIIDPKKLCERRLYRSDCKIVGQMYYKDISSFGYNLKDVILMDNSEISFGLQPENGLLCPDFFQNKQDTYLRDIMPVLRQLAVCDDVRPVLDTID